MPLAFGYTYWVGVENPSTGKAAMYLDVDVVNENYKYKIMTIK